MIFTNQCEKHEQKYSKTMQNITAEENVGITTRYDQQHGKIHENHFQMEIFHGKHHCPSNNWDNDWDRILSIP